MPAIESLRIRRILDSRGNPTVEVDVRAGDVVGRAAAPSGASTGTHEVRAWPKGGADEGIVLFRKEIAPRLKGLESTDQGAVDAALHAVDGTPDFSRIGGNVAVATSLAVAKASAAAARTPLFAYLGDGRTPPFPLGNVIGGGRHAIGGTDIQEFLTLAQSPVPSKSVFANAQVHKAVAGILQKKLPGEALGRGDEGAWIAKLSNEDALAVLVEACREVSKETGIPCAPALDMAASEFYRQGKYVYRDRTLTPERQVEYVAGLVESHDLALVEDPLDEEDFDGYARLTEFVGDRCAIVGDDLFVTNPERLRTGIEKGAANAILIKPNQIGTLTDTARTVSLAQEAGYRTVMSHRSGETTDDAIAHLAVAFGAFAIKTGAVGGERTAKLNELIRIEEYLGG
ncbi:MAG TPA: phosphopyruvate hydratase [Thermoplasmata archaeon]|nr:phosphopyruvate hydratase [Thermoplasmata archaeon]